MATILEKQDGEQEQAIGYDCIYHYELHRIKLEFDIKNGLWKIIPLESYEEEKKLVLMIFNFLLLINKFK